METLKKIFEMIVGKSWQTTLAGWALTFGIANTAGWFDPITGKPRWMVIGLAVLGAIVSRRMKDASVTGGTVPATAEAAVRLDKPQEVVDALPGIVPAALSPGLQGEQGDRGPKGATGAPGGKR